MRQDYATFTMLQSKIGNHCRATRGGLLCKSKPPVQAKAGAASEL